MSTLLESRHGETPRDVSKRRLDALSGHADPGKFGRMFAFLEPLKVEDGPLLTLARGMKDGAADAPEGSNSAIPAGFTYLGQFVDHDITLDLTPLAQQVDDPMAVKNFRTPGLDLDALYGSGSALQPYLYDRDPKDGSVLPKLLIGTAGPSDDQAGQPIPAFPNDLPRNRLGRAIIGDERNDENLLVAQTHLAFLKFHNKIVDWLIDRRPELAAKPRRGELFDEARRMATWHYQWIVLFDFVERLTEKGLVRRIMQQGRRFYRFKTTPYIPVEFSAAAYRLGHSMVRERYNHNRVFGLQPGALAPGSLRFMFHFTGKSGAILGDMAGTVDPANFPGPGPFPFLPSNWIIDWRQMYDFPGSGVVANPSRSLDPMIVPALHTLPGETNPDLSEDENDKRRNLAFRNLRRGVQLGLPSGQAIARAMGVAPLTPEEVGSGHAGAAAVEAKLTKATPLWFYILKEAEVQHQGRRLGDVGSLIVAETFLGLVHGDTTSFLQRRSNWVPELPGAAPGEFTMVDLLNFVGDVNPIG